MSKYIIYMFLSIWYCGSNYSYVGLDHTEIFCENCKEENAQKITKVIFKEFVEDSVSILIGDTLVFNGLTDGNPQGFEHKFFTINWEQFNTDTISIFFHRKKKVVRSKLKKCYKNIYLMAFIDTSVSKINFSDGVPEEVIIPVPDEFIFLYCDYYPSNIGLGG